LSWPHGGAATPRVACQRAELSTRRQGSPVLQYRNAFRRDRGRRQCAHEVGHLDRLQAIECALTRHPGLFITGSGFRGVGIPDCVADARQTARAIIGFLNPNLPSAI
jgi:oxygen-dependent protoporphyrinogen oxidase